MAKIDEAKKQSKNKESMQVIAQKFLRWYQEVLSNIESTEENWDMTQRISF